MENKDKKGLGILAAIGAGVAGIVLAVRAKAKPPGEGEGGASLQIEVYDSEGNLVPHNSPLNVTEGGSYTIRVTVTNTSYIVNPSYPVAARLVITVAVQTNVRTLLGDSMTLDFTASERKTLSWNFTVPVGTAGEAGGVIAAAVDTPGGIQLASAGDTMTITEAATVYGATIVIS